MSLVCIKDVFLAAVTCGMPTFDLGVNYSLEHEMFYIYHGGIEGPLAEFSTYELSWRLKDAPNNFMNFVRRTIEKRIDRAMPIGAV